MKMNEFRRNTRARKPLAAPPVREGSQAGMISPASHARALHITSMLTRNFRQMHKRKAADILPADVIKVLNDAGVKFTLVGAHGIAGWLIEPRSSQDVDVLIQSRHRKAIQAIKKAYPTLIAQDLPVVTRFLDPLDKKPLIDLLKPLDPLLKVVPKNAYQVGKTHRVPDLEMSLALKYAAMISPNRDPRKRDLDRADFKGIVYQNFDSIDRDKLFSLGEMAKNGGGPEVVKLVDDAHAERRSDSHG